MTRALVIGESLIDVVNDGAQMSEHPGGSPMNVAVGLARLGRDVELATWIGDDAHGHIITDYVAADNVHLAAASRGATRTSTATATLTGGQASYQFDLDWALPAIHIPQHCLVVHTGSLACGIDPGRRVVAPDGGHSAGGLNDHLRPQCSPEPIGRPTYCT